MSFIEAVKSCFSNYVGFSGRASRSEFWWFMLFYVICAVVGGFLGDVAGGIVGLILLLPTLAVQVRRLHDIGKSGWWVLIGLIPLIGQIVLIYFSVQPSGGANEYGSGPAAAAAA